MCLRGAARTYNKHLTCKGPLQEAVLNKGDITWFSPNWYQTVRPTYSPAYLHALCHPNFACDLNTAAALLAWQRMLHVLKCRVVVGSYEFSLLLTAGRKLSFQQDCGPPTWIIHRLVDRAS